jgi:hypothetical protein
MSVFNNISKYLPHTTVRSINKQLYHKNVEYCELAKNIYNNDMKLYTNKNNTIIYYEYEKIIYGVMIKNDIYIIYKIKQVDQYIQLSIHKKYPKDYLDDNNMIDVDIMTKHKILKSRGCEDIIPNYSKTNTTNLLLNTFKTNFNPDIISDIVYLYMYLHSNCVLLDYEKVIDEHIMFKINKLPSEEILHKIYDMYNLLYVHVNMGY